MMKEKNSVKNHLLKTMLEEKMLLKRWKGQPRGLTRLLHQSQKKKMKKKNRIN
jgi:hypothetical protein